MRHQYVEYREWNQRNSSKGNKGIHKEWNQWNIVKDIVINIFFQSLKLKSLYF